jgi:hypothetical protein
LDELASLVATAAGAHLTMTNKHIGSTFASFLDDEGVREDVELRTKKRNKAAKKNVLAGQQRTRVRRWLDGQARAAARNREEAAKQGPNPTQAVAEALSAVDALAEMGLWPGPRDPASEAAVIAVRQRWTRIERKAMRERRR